MMLKYKGQLYKRVDGKESLNAIIDAVYKGVQNAEAELRKASMFISGNKDIAEVKHAYNELERLIKELEKARNIVTPIQKLTF